MPGRPVPKKPGKSFVQMFDLIYTNNLARDDFGHRLMIAIFWEESLFNNVVQGGAGTGVGYGQVEPAELWRMKEYGLTPPPVKKVGKQTVAVRPLSDRECVLAATALLGSLLKRLGSRAAALRGYAGYQWAKANPGSAKPTAAERLAIIANWEACEVALKDVRPFRRPTRDEQDVIMDGLNTARPFKPRREVFRPLLFPSSHYK